MKAMLGAFWNDSLGSELVEWAMVVLILLTASVIGLLAIRDQLLLVIQDIFSQMQRAPRTDY